MQTSTRKRRFTLKIKELKMKADDRFAMMSAYRHVREMNKLAKKASPDLRAIFTNEVKALRADYTYSYAQRFYKVTLALGPHVNEIIFPHYPETSNITDMKTELIKRISKGRNAGRTHHSLKREFQGMRYNMVAPPVHFQEANIFYNNVTGKPVELPKMKYMPNFKGGGAVFEKPGTILELLNSDDYKLRIRRAKKPYDKANFVGVELEIIAKIDRERLDQMFIDAKLAGSVYIKYDGSIRTEKAGEFAHEITLIAKEKDINSVISRVCAILNDKEVGGYVNNSCGMHVHLDMRSRDVEESYKRLHAALPVLGKMVPPDRTDTDHGKRYCSLTCADNFKDATKEGSRYKALNAISYQSHKTLEIRLHSGTINAKKINYWTNFLMSIINGKDQATDGTIEMLQVAYGLSEELVDYVKARTKKFENRHLDTRIDHFEDAVA